MDNFVFIGKVIFIEFIHFIISFRCEFYESTAVYLQNCRNVPKATVYLLSIFKLMLALLNSEPGAFGNTRHQFVVAQTKSQLLRCQSWNSGTADRLDVQLRPWCRQRYRPENIQKERWKNTDHAKDIIATTSDVVQDTFLVCSNLAPSQSVENSSRRITAKSCYLHGLKHWH